MFIRQMLMTLVAGIAIGVLAFLILVSRGPDPDLHEQRIQGLRGLERVDLELNRQIARAQLFGGYQDKNLLSSSQKFGGELAKLREGAGLFAGLGGAVDQAFEKYRDVVEEKIDFSTDYQNLRLYQRLIAGLDAAHDAVETVAKLIPQDQQGQLPGLLATLRLDLLTHGMHPLPDNQPAIEKTLVALATQTAEGTPELRDAVARLLAISRTIVTDKTAINAKLDSIVGLPSGARLADIEAAYTRIYQSQQAEADRYRQALAGYAVTLLLVLGWLGLRLRSSYRALDSANSALQDTNAHLEEMVAARTADLQAAYNNLRESQAQLVQSEKMASLGQMVAGVAHEINTPLGYARSNAEIVRGSLTDLRALAAAQDKALRLVMTGAASDEDVATAFAEAQACAQNTNAVELVEELDNLLQDTDYGLLQIAELVSSLKDFSRVDRSRTDLFNVNDGIASALKIGNNLLKDRIEVVRNFGAVDDIECSPSQLNQVFLNIITNAAQAIDGDGQIVIHTVPEANGVGIRMLDSGSGMPEEVKQRIFEPFFTTKPIGKGTGLGLSIVYRIIQEHGGRIEVRSQPDQGSEFIIWLPKKQSQAADGVTA